jgi:hypothetical protein
MFIFPTPSHAINFQTLQLTHKNSNLVLEPAMGILIPPFPSSFTSSTTHKHPTSQISTKTLYQSKCMHGHQRQNQFCIHSDLNLYKYFSNLESDHQHNNTFQFHKFKSRAQSVKVSKFCPVVRGLAWEGSVAV